MLIFCLTLHVAACEGLQALMLAGLPAHHSTRLLKLFAPAPLVSGPDLFLASLPLHILFTLPRALAALPTVSHY